MVTSVNQNPWPKVSTPTAYSSVSGGAGLMIVTVYVGETTVFRLHVGTTLLGHQHAIVGYEEVPLS